MGSEDRVDTFVRALAEERRVLVIGGLAVIAHGLSRSTKDADIWMEPHATPGEWAATLLRSVARFEGATIHGLPGWWKVTEGELAGTIEEIGMVRVLGLGRPVDVFRRPNEFEEDGFEAVWLRSSPAKDGTRLPDPLDLLVTKEETGRARDQNDIHFLEGLVRQQFGERLALADPDEARALLDRYADHAVCAKALGNPHPEVREMAREILVEFAEAGDPFARDLLKAGGASG